MTPEQMHRDVDQIHTILCSFKLALDKAQKDGTKVLEIADVPGTKLYVKDGLDRCLNLKDTLKKLEFALE